VGDESARRLCCTIFAILYIITYQQQALTIETF